MIPLRRPPSAPAPPLIGGCAPPRLEQPLWFFVREKAELAEVFAGRAEVAPSVRNYYDTRRPSRLHRSPAGHARG